ncbi:MAG: OB-fold nucleic acid binding domain-containing protein [Candidatus Hodarchaeota archaeon]
MRRRSPYRRVRIGNITRSELIKNDDERWRLLTPDGKYLFRVWIMGFITDKFIEEGNFTNLKVEDGSGAIIVKSNEETLDKFQQWDKIEVLGQIQISEGNEEIDVFLSPDIIQIISEDNWFLYHRLMIVKQLHHSALAGVKSATIGGVELEGVASIEDLKKRLKEIVKTLDTGNGVTLEQFCQELPNIDEAQIFDAITELLESGEFFEPKVGIYSSAFDS